MKTSFSHSVRIDLRKLPASARRPLVFETFEQLQPGDTLLLTHGHHSTLLHYLLLAEAPRKFSWEYLEEGPKVWRILIQKNASQANHASCTSHDRHADPHQTRLH